MEQNPIIRPADVIQNKQSAVLATIIDVKGASPDKVGAKIILLAESTAVGIVGGGKLGSSLPSDAQEGG